jgi:hypothetical protein
MYIHPLYTQVVALYDHEADAADELNFSAGDHVEVCIYVYIYMYVYLYMCTNIR